VSTVAVTRFYDSTIGKKAVMAVTGLILFGFLIAHMAGNLQVFLGKAVMNHYAETLHGTPEVLWPARIVLLVSVLLHIWASIQLTSAKSAARPIGYVKPGNVQASTASKTMMLSGPVIGAFVVGHLLHLTTGTIHPNFVELHAYENVVNGFSNPIASDLGLGASAMASMIGAYVDIDFVIDRGSIIWESAATREGNPTDVRAR